MKKLIFRALIASFILSIGILGFLYHFIARLPQIGQLEYYEPIVGTQIYDRNGHLLKEYTVEKRKVIPLNEVPQNLKNAIIAIEDSDFYHHIGINIKRIIGAAIADIKARRIVEGGSTLTQQLAKVLFLTPKKTIGRKIQELLLALQIEKRYSKDEILQMYLNQIYFGAGNYGIQAAAKYYFGKDVRDLSLPECALLAGLPRSPNGYNPIRHPERALKRRNIVLYRMRTLGYISELEYIEALNTPLILAKPDTTVPTGAYFLEYIRRFIEQEYGYNGLYKSGLKVYTTIDFELQKKAEQLYEDHLVRLDKTVTPYHTEDTIPVRIMVSDTEYIDTYTIDTSPPKLQAALIAIEAKTGDVITMIGGRNFRESQFNRAIQAHRQPGSAIKPIIYTAAIEKGYTVMDYLYDGPIMFQYGDSYWIPENYEKRFYGWTTIKQALAHSRNVVTIKLFENLGIKPVQNLLNRLQIQYEPPLDLSFALGTLTFTPLQLCKVYNIYPNQGFLVEPRFIRKITDRYGTVLYERPLIETDVISPEVAYIMTYLLKNVVDRGTGQRIRWMGFRRKCGGKTGTTDKYRDAWFIGFTPYITTAVWVGYDDMRPIGPKMTGSRAALPLWTRFMMEASKRYPDSDFPEPHNIVWRRYDPETLKLSDTAPAEPFIKKTHPIFVGKDRR